MASLHLRLVLIATAIAIVCFCQLSANASQRSPRALATQISQDPATLLYTIEIRQRTPVQIQRLVLDIEQDYMWVRCDKKSYRSSTYSPVACSAQLCKSYQNSRCGTCHGPRAPGCNNDTCVVPGRRSDSFELAQDLAALRSSNGSNPGPLVRIPRLIFACASQGDLSDLPPGTAGVAGMSSSTLALPAQLSAGAGFDRNFVMCLPSDSAPGVLYFGDHRIALGGNESTILFRTPLIKNPVYTSAFYIGVQRIEVDGIHVPVDPERLRIDAKGRGGTRLSTLVPYTQLATPIYNSLVDVYTSSARQINISRVASVVPFGACFDSSGASYTDTFRQQVTYSLPSIDLVLQGNSAVWGTVNSMFQVNSNGNVFCLGFVDAGEDPVASIVIGTFQMKDNLLFQLDLTTMTLSLYYRSPQGSGLNSTNSTV
jgi:hypothetical protein